MMKFNIINDMTDERIEKLGKYFTHHNVQNRTGLTFERFIQLNKEGRWNTGVWLN